MSRPDTRPAHKAPRIGTVLCDCQLRLPCPPRFPDPHTSSNSAPGQFDHTGINRECGSNWLLKSTNLKLLLQQLSLFYTNELGRDASEAISSVDVAAIARDGDDEAMHILLELLLGCAVQCENKGEFIQQIMTLAPQEQQVHTPTSSDPHHAAHHCGACPQSLMMLIKSQMDRFPAIASKSETPPPSPTLAAASVDMSLPQASP